jgi:hypothetical protein
MAAPHLKVAQLDEGHLTKLRALEQELGACVVAVEKDTRFADLSERQLKRLQAGEKDLDVVLLAYECN